MNVVAESDSQKNENTELIKKVELDGTPFTIIETEGKVFGVMGQYRITEPYETVEEVEDALREINYNRIVQVISIMMEQYTTILDELKRIKNEN